MVSLSASAQVAIERDPLDVWDYISNPVNQDAWVDEMSDSEIVGDAPVGRGTQVRCTFTYSAGASPALLTVTEYREGRALAVEATEGPFPFTGRLTLERSAASTIVTNEMTTGSDHIVTSIMFTVLRPLMKRMMRKQVEKELGQLKAILESGE